MLAEVIPFQTQAEIELRRKTALAMSNYREVQDPQVISFTAPTGAGKTIMITSLIEDIFFGMSKYDSVKAMTVAFEAQPNAIFVWLSDSPELNEQSKDKIIRKSDKIKAGKCITIDDDSLTGDILEDGNIYFLNTQKIGKKGKLTTTSDTRQYTIWDILENTAREKSDRLYFIIDEAHRGMKGTEAGKQTTIMQKFLKGSEKDGLSPMPVVIGMSATIERFNKLVAGINSSLHKVNVPAEAVRSSGLLKERIIITHPEELNAKNDMTILKAAAMEWNNKCVHWKQYADTQHEAYCFPIFVVQVQNGTGQNITDTNLDDCLATIEDALGVRFGENEVVHSFGDVEDITVNGLTVHHVKASEISDDKRIKIVFFKENLSTGWDCPRAETMMSFRKVEEYTNIAQLLGRMVRTPMMRSIKVDMSLNDVHLYLPYYNTEAVKKVVDNLQEEEGGNIPTYIEDDPFEGYAHEVLVAPKPRNTNPYSNIDENQTTMPGTSVHDNVYDVTHGKPETDDTPSFTPIPEPVPATPVITVPTPTPAPTVPKTKTPADDGEQLKMISLRLDREEIVDFINNAALLNYEIRSIETTDYFTALLKLCRLLKDEKIDTGCYKAVQSDIVEMIHDYITELKKAGEYKNKADEVTSLKFLIEVFTPFGEIVPDHNIYNLFTSSNEDLDRQVRNADLKLGGIGIPFEYARKYDDEDFRADSIIFAANNTCMENLKAYAKEEFRKLCNKYRTVMANKDEACARKYDSIVTSADPVSEHNFKIPSRIEPRIDKDGKKYYNHLLITEEGYATIKLNSSWEERVIEEEANRPDFVAWLRNPSRGSWALRMPYKKGGKDTPMYPDFIVVRRDDVAKYLIDILEPHNPELDDNLEKAKALAEYARKNPKVGRIQLIRGTKNAIGKQVFKRLELTDLNVQEKVSKAISNDELDHIFDTDGFVEEVH